MHFAPFSAQHIPMVLQHSMNTIVLTSDRVMTVVRSVEEAAVRGLVALRGTLCGAEQREQAESEDRPYRSKSSRSYDAGKRSV